MKSPGPLDCTAYPAVIKAAYSAGRAPERLPPPAGLRFTVRVLRIGLTGGIGAGKSAVAARLAELGAVVVDADRLAREVVAPGTGGLREIVAAFGPEVLDAAGALDRQALGARVFGDDAARRTLEGIIHPRVRRRTAELVAAASPDAIVVNDVPLLVETGLAATYHLVIVVDAAEPTRVARLVRTRGMSETEAYARIRAQATDEQRRAAADVLLRNEGSLPDLRAEVDALWRGRLRPYEENLRLGRPARASAVGGDMAGRFARVAARLRHAGGDLVGRVDHVGGMAVPGAPSDGVPGAPGDGVLDVQVTVARPEDAGRLGPLLAEAGFPAVAGDEHGSADPGEPARVHLRPGGTPGWSP